MQGYPGGCGPELEEAQRLDTVADQQVFSLLIVIQHHFVSLTPDTRLLITAKGGVRRIEVITVGPDAPGFNRPAHTVSTVDIAGPDAST